MKIDNKFITGLAESRDPFPLIWQYLIQEIWLPKGNIRDYYAQEKDMTTFELFLSRVYSEIYTELLPRACMDKGKTIDLSQPVIVLDSLSIREAVLIQKELQEKGLNVKLSFSYSSLPSDTVFFKEKVSYSDLGKKHSISKIQDPNKISFTGNEDIIWSVFPDAKLETISAGRTKLARVEDMYKECKDILLKVVDKIGTDKLLVISDHGYTRAEGAYSFKTSEKDQRELRKVMGGSRYIPIGEIDADYLVKGGYLINFNGYYMARGRYTWTIGGKYEIFQHGGVSLLESLTPRLEIER